jgi:pimeloyl-ACP methyl ester carboxylesterase
MRTVRSDDGTAIAYDSSGTGPALILVDGAMCTRVSGSKPELVKLLSADFTVYSYDRRGRGDSGDTQPYAVEREIADIRALADAAGGAAYLYGHSSGASLALEAALAIGGTIISKLALYDAPYNDDPRAVQAWRRYLADLAGLLADGRNGDAVARFMAHMGILPGHIEGMRQGPGWAGLGAVAPALAYITPRSWGERLHLLSRHRHGIDRRVRQARAEGRLPGARGRRRCCRTGPRPGLPSRPARTP